MPLVMVKFEWVRSAEPPIVAWVAALMTPSAISEDLRVATFGFSATSLARSVRERLGDSRRDVGLP